MKPADYLMRLLQVLPNIDITDAAKGQLAFGAKCGEGERVVKIPRHTLVLATLIATAAAQVSIWSDPIGPVLMNTYVADTEQATAQIRFSLSRPGRASRRLPGRSARHPHGQCRHTHPSCLHRAIAR